MEKVDCEECGKEFETKAFNLGMGGTPLCPDCRPGGNDDSG